MLANARVRRVVLQAVFAILLVGGLYYLWFNLISNMQSRNLSTDFGFLFRAAGFGISGSDFSPSSTIGAAFIVGLKNTVVVAALGIALATILGVIVGVARLSTNWLVSKGAALYVETFRNVPVLVVIIFASAALILNLPGIDRSYEWLDLVVLSNRGLWIPWVDRTGPRAATFLVLVGVAVIVAAVIWRWRTNRQERTGEPHHRVAWAAGVIVGAGLLSYVVLGGPVSLTIPERTERAVAGGFKIGAEFAALLTGLVMYTTSHISEVVRGSILSVSKGQTEAALAVGLSPFQTLRHVILPQAFRTAVPPLANQYLNLMKNTSLGAAIGFAELTGVVLVAIGNGVPAPQAIATMMAIYLCLSLVIAAATNTVNRRLARSAAR